MKYVESCVNNKLLPLPTWLLSTCRRCALITFQTSDNDNYCSPTCLYQEGSVK